MRMSDRAINEVDLRVMLYNATDFRKSVNDGRWVISTRLRRVEWEVVIEPDFEEKVQVVITAYPVEMRK